MNFLVKFGQLVAKGAAIVFGLESSGLLKSSSGPLQVVSKDLAEMAQVVLDAEAILQTPGNTMTIDQIVQYEAQRIGQIVLSSAVLIGKPIQDMTLITGPTGAATDFANGVAKMLKAIHPDAVKEVSPEHAGA